LAGEKNPWNNIAKELNSQSYHNNRTTKMLQIKYEGEKRKLRILLKHIKKTVGSEAEYILYTEEEEQLLKILAVSVTGL
jgi:hypothetical protein